MMMMTADSSVDDNQRIPNGPYTVVHADVKIGTPNLTCVSHVIYCTFDGYNNFFEHVSSPALCCYNPS